MGFGKEILTKVRMTARYLERVWDGAPSAPRLNHPTMESVIAGPNPQSIFLLYRYLIHVFIATGYYADYIQAFGFTGHINFCGGGEIRICN